MKIVNNPSAKLWNYPILYTRPGSKRNHRVVANPPHLKPTAHCLRFLPGRETLTNEKKKNSFRSFVP